MGRKIPTGESPSVHPILFLSLFAASMAASVAIVSSICALSRKKSPPSEQKTTQNSDAAVVPETNDTTTATSTSTPLDPLPLPPAAVPPPPRMLKGSGAASYHFRSNSIASHGKLPRSLSTTKAALRQLSLRDDKREKKREKKLKHEDSIWKKTIILGEKCRVPDEDDDTILYDESGNRISTYHPKTAGSVPVSRQTSCIEPDAIPAFRGQDAS